jgi:hypothetical protein
VVIRFGGRFYGRTAEVFKPGRTARRAAILHTRISLSSEHELFCVKRLGDPLGGATANAAEPRHRKKRIVAEPGSLSLARKMPAYYFNLLTNLLERQGYEDCRIAEIPVIFGNLILKNEMIPEGIVGQLRNQPMILVSVFRPVGQDQRWIEVGFDRLEVVFDLGALEWEIPIAKTSDIDSRFSRPMKECSRALSGFRFTNFGGAEDDPSHCQVRKLRNKTQHGSTAANLNVIGMGAQAKQL